MAIKIERSVLLFHKHTSANACFTIRSFNVVYNAVSTKLLRAFVTVTVLQQVVSTNQAKGPRATHLGFFETGVRSGRSSSGAVAARIGKSVVVVDVVAATLGCGGGFTGNMTKACSTDSISQMDRGSKFVATIVASCSCSGGIAAAKLVGKASIRFITLTTGCFENWSIGISSRPSQYVFIKGSCCSIIIIHAEMSTGEMSSSKWSSSVVSIRRACQRGGRREGWVSRNEEIYLYYIINGTRHKRSETRANQTVSS